MEHRWGERTVLNVRVRISTDTLVGDGILRNLSISGAFIETSMPLAAMGLVQVRVLRRGKRQGSREAASGFVVRKARDGVGIEWMELAALRAGAATHEDPATGNDFLRNPARQDRN